MLYMSQEVHCPACGTRRKADRFHDIHDVYGLCCDQSCFREIEWKFVLHTMGKPYYPDPKGTGRWAPDRKES